jgi:hypothetical protein
VPTLTGIASGLGVIFRNSTVWPVLRRLLANQYRVRPAGTLREKKPIMNGT